MITPVLITPGSNHFAGVAAAGTLTMDTKPITADDLTIGDRTYTFLDVLTQADGEVFIGANLAATQANLLAAIDLSGTAGTQYGSAMTANRNVSFGAWAANDVVITATEAYLGHIGNTIATTENFTAGTNVFDAVTLGTTAVGRNAVKGFWGFSIAEDAGAAAHVKFRKGSATGQILADIKLQASESAMILFPEPMEASSGVWVEEVAGSIEGILYTET